MNSFIVAVVVPSRVSLFVKFHIVVCTCMYSCLQFINIYMYVCVLIAGQVLTNHCFACKDSVSDYDCAYNNPPEACGVDQVTVAN